MASQEPIQPLTSFETSKPLQALPTDQPVKSFQEAEAKAATPGTTGGGGEGEKSSYSSMQDLKVAAPELYDKMMQGIAQQICASMRDHAERLKRLMREGRQR